MPLRPHLAAVCMLLAVPLLSGQPVAPVPPGRPSLEIRRAATPPRIDGVINPAEWAGAAHTDDLHMVEPTEGGVPTERTEFWVTYDPDNVYVAIRSHDSAGRAGVRAYSMQRDQDNGSDDLVRVVFDTFHRENDGYYFALTAAGGRHDGLIQNKDEANDQWDAIWLGQTSIDAGGWSAEFAIPVKSLAFDPANDTWGFNIARAVRRKGEVIRWTGIVRTRPTIALPLLGELRGLTGLRQGRGLDFKPYASAIHRTDPAPDEKQFELRPGFDLVWHVTPSLAATLTVNTDFADAEVDERQVNLGRFSLFFPEKRAFFTQDASLFTFGGITQDPLPFFSRRIGLADDGTKVDVLGGLKLTGRAGPWTLGVLDVQTDRHGGVAGQNLFAGRVARQVLAESSFGVIATHGDPTGAGDNTLAGADFNYVNSHLFGSKSLSARFAVQATDSDRAGGTGAASTVTVNYPNEPFQFNWWFSRVDDRFDPALGFVSRTGIQDLHLNHGWVFRPKSGAIQMINPFLETDHVTDLRGHLLDNGRWAGVYAENARGDFANVWLGHSAETYDAPFEIRPGIVIPTGRHVWDYAQFQFGTSRSRPMDVRLRWRHGDFLTGRGDDYIVHLGARPSYHLELDANWTLRDIRLPQGAFTVKTASLKVAYTFTPDLQLSLLGQYDNFSDSLGVNFRVKWIVQPGNELFFIVNQGYDTSLDRFRPTATETSLKGAWTYRF